MIKDDQDCKDRKEQRLPKKFALKRNSEMFRDMAPSGIVVIE